MHILLPSPSLDLSPEQMATVQKNRAEAIEKRRKLDEAARVIKELPAAHTDVNRATHVKAQCADTDTPGDLNVDEYFELGGSELWEEFRKVALSV